MCATDLFVLFEDGVKVTTRFIALFGWKCL
jgi:hypothetical protein